MNLQEYFSALRSQRVSRPPSFAAHLFFSPLPSPRPLAEDTPTAKVVFFYETSKLSEPQKGESKRLFHRMIEAMGIDPKNYGIVEFSKEEPENPRFLEKLWEKTAHSPPDFILAFGVLATNLLLGRKERISQVHGRFFKTTLSAGSKKFQTEIVPIFHTDFLLINPAMKRVVWSDLKKVMQALSS